MILDTYIYVPQVLNTYYLYGYLYLILILMTLILILIFNT